MSMKISVEMENDLLKYAYEIGTSHQSGSMGVNPENLAIFTQFLQLLDKYASHDAGIFMDDVQAKAWVERNPEKYRDILKRHDDQHPHLLEKP